jgi:phospholipase C
VCSEVFDHTSVIRFLEARFGVAEPNITAWRRAVAGDLTRCFDFDQPNVALPELPDMSAARGEELKLDGPAVSVPAKQALPRQDVGLRYSRALPYELSARLWHEPERERLHLELDNTGEAGVVLHLYDRVQRDRAPRRYLVEAGKQLRDELPLPHGAGRYDFQLLGPNGFARYWACERETSAPEVELLYRPQEASLELRARSRGAAQQLVLTPNAYRVDIGRRMFLPASGEWKTCVWSVEDNGNWYDFTLTSSLSPSYEQRFAGRLETGAHGISDPALGTFQP